MNTYIYKLRSTYINTHTQSAYFPRKTAWNNIAYHTMRPHLMTYHATTTVNREDTKRLLALTTLPPD